MTPHRPGWIWTLLLPSALFATSEVQATDWLPVTAEELQLTSEPKAPGATAIYLYRQVDRDDTDASELQYERIKILKEEGRKYADVEIPYVKGVEGIQGIDARTIRPDGTIARFDGTVYDKPIVSGRGVKLMAKTFTMPEAGVGSIIEYRYRRFQDSRFVFDSHWILSQELFTRHARFSLIPSPYFALQWMWPRGLPEGTSNPEKDHTRIRLETHDVPAFVTEEYMPPANELKYRVDFIYADDARFDKSPAEFWKRRGKSSFHDFEKFMDRKKEMERAVAGIVQPGDTSEAKMRKIYARVQGIRNETFEREKSEEERKRDHQGEARNVEDVLSRGSADASQVNCLFVALARAAGLQASIAMVSTRDEYFFDPRWMNSRQLNSNIVMVTAEGRSWFLDPGVPFTPFGMLPWNETAVQALRLNADGGEWTQIPLPDPAASRIERKTQLKLETNGTLKGKVVIRYTGLEAGWRRLQERNEDETERKEFLENQIRSAVPSGIEVKLTNHPDWTASDEPLVAEFDLEIPGWAAAAGQRQLLKVGLFGAEEDRIFEHQTRTQPMYFDFPYQYSDDISIELPAGRRVSSVPRTQGIGTKIFSFSLAAEDREGTLHLQRDITMNMLLVSVKYYDQLRQYFETVRTGDEAQVVIAPGQPVAQR